MIEMLGVLALVGVLSVGGIAGYSKAMFMYKTNKQTEQLGSIIRAINLNRERFEHRENERFTPSGPFRYNLVPILKAMGEIPDEMIISNVDASMWSIDDMTEEDKEYIKNNYIKDSFGLPYIIRYDHSEFMPTAPSIGTFIGAKDGVNICKNLLQIAKKFNLMDMTLMTGITAVYAVNGGYNGVAYGFGSYCNEDSYIPSSQCLINFALHDIDNFCHRSCEAGCQFYLYLM